MKLERGLKHQVDAVNSIVRVLENVNIEKTNSLTENPVIDLASPNIIKNIKKIQKNNKNELIILDFAIKVSHFSQSINDIM